MSDIRERKFAQFSFGTQVRKSPFSDAALRWGAQGFSVYNHMYIPRDFGDPIENFWNLVNDAILCDVAVERQVEITGIDAARLTQLIVCRDLSTCEVGQCKYVFITDNDGGIINDPILLKLAEDRFWLSIADSDVLLWVKGVAAALKMRVHVREPDVSPLQIQGPRSREIIRKAFSDAAAELNYYRFTNHDWNGVPLVISRTGWSSELGFEIFLCDSSKGDLLWEHLMEVGQPLGLHPGHTSSIRRIEGAMLSYQADMTLDNNPFEMGMDRLVDLDKGFDFLGKAALEKIQKSGVERLHAGFEFDGPPLVGTNDSRWPIFLNNFQIGEVTSAIHSPRLNKNIALGFVRPQYATIGHEACIHTNGSQARCTVVPKPFFDPQKKITRS